MRTSGLAAALLAASAGLGCGDDPPPANQNQNQLPAGCDALVSPGDNDQEAVQQALGEAKEGSTVCFAAGTYRFTLQLDLAAQGVTLKGAGKDATIFDFGGQISGANGLAITGDGVTVEELQVKNTKGDGIRATAVDDITFRNLKVIWDAQASMANGDYGLYPVQSTGVRVEGCTVVGARDVGIYVGQSKNIVVAGNETYGNVAGIEAENSFDADIRENNVHDNAGGILILNLPGRPMLAGERAKVHDNIVENNNGANFASPGTIAAQIPPGTGFLLLAAKNNELHNNTVRGNQSTGLLTVSYNETLFGPADDPAYDLYSEGNWTHDNTFDDNGTDPQALVKMFAPTPAPDVLWDGCVNAAKPNMANALTNCVSNNGSADYLNFDLCGGGAAADTDLAKVTCEHMALPAIP